LGDQLAPDLDMVPVEVSGALKNEVASRMDDILSTPTQPEKRKGLTSRK
jgi:hypothetical protein